MPERSWLILNLEAPLLSFGGVTIDAIGVTRDFPSLSMLTGLFANALGWRRTQWEEHQALQDRLIFAARRERENPSGLLTDTQNVNLEKNDRGWTTWGGVEKRGGDSYGGPHRRFRDYHMDARVSLAVRLESSPDGPDLDHLAEALDRPKRPLFIGRKTCLPTGRVVGGFITAKNAYEALEKSPLPEETRALWPLGEGPAEGQCVDRVIDLPDLRNWRTGLHGGARKVVEGRIAPQRTTP
ncbi:type I-E CRISPR-associated protein Cas5/CasD [Pannonibacter phragmitetus]|uniref:type I-E CRISPR-associated protein Cas5/CasD n=1 Tax=Pannonibacter phragmitetus TaxID=121719 RepID=UPI000F0319B9|nr:type I-E CRISPR-associated protein Cas5/CasD [Pannonibacter phragmitetus]